MSLPCPSSFLTCDNVLVPSFAAVRTANSVALLVSAIVGIFVACNWKNANISPDDAKKEADAAASKV